MGEKLKNVLIIVLLCSAFVLGWQSRLFGNNPGELGSVVAMLDRLGSNPDPDGAGDESPEANAAAKPICIAVTNNEGLHYGVRYDIRELDAVYQKAVLMMNDAFENALPPNEAGESAWRKALMSPGIYFEYLSPVKIDVLDGWFGTEITGDWKNSKVRRVCVAETGGTAALFYEEYDTGRFYTADTKISVGFEALTESFGVNSAVFAFEVRDDAESPDIYSLLMPDMTSYSVVEADNPLYDDAVLSEALKGLGISDQPSYQDQSGTENYIDNKFTLTLKRDGTIIFRLRESGGAGGGALSESEAVELARAAVAGSIGRCCGDAGVYLDAVTSLGGGVYQVTFRYVVAGGIVQLRQDGFAAVVTIRGGLITEMELRFRSYLITEEKEPLLPEIQAWAASSGPFAVSYNDTGEGRLWLAPGWIAVPYDPLPQGEGIG